MVSLSSYPEWNPPSRSHSGFKATVKIWASYWLPQVWVEIAFQYASHAGVTLLIRNNRIWFYSLRILPVSLYCLTRRRRLQRFSIGKMHPLEVTWLQKTRQKTQKLMMMRITNQIQSPNQVILILQWLRLWVNWFLLRFGKSSISSCTLVQGLNPASEFNQSIPESKVEESNRDCGTPFRSESNVLREAWPHRKFWGNRMVVLDCLTKGVQCILLWRTLSIPFRTTGKFS